jgi:hypothetical protein
MGNIYDQLISRDLERNSRRLDLSKTAKYSEWLVTGLNSYWVHLKYKFRFSELAEYEKKKKGGTYTYHVFYFEFYYEILGAMKTRTN